MAMTKPKSSQIEHRGESVQKVIDDITQEDGVLTSEAAWTDVPKLKGANANKQALALANRVEFLHRNSVYAVPTSEYLDDLLEVLQDGAIVEDQSLGVRWKKVDGAFQFESVSATTRRTIRSFWKKSDSTADMLERALRSGLPLDFEDFVYTIDRQITASAKLNYISSGARIVYEGPSGVDAAALITITGHSYGIGQLVFDGGMRCHKALSIANNTDDFWDLILKDLSCLNVYKTIAAVTAECLFVAGAFRRCYFPDFYAKGAVISSAPDSVGSNGVRGATVKSAGGSRYPRKVIFQNPYVEDVYSENPELVGDQDGIGIFSPEDSAMPPDLPDTGMQMLVEGGTFINTMTRAFKGQAQRGDIKNCEVMLTRGRASSTPVGTSFDMQTGGGSVEGITAIFKGCAHAGVALINMPQTVGKTPPEGTIRNIKVLTSTAITGPNYVTHVSARVAGEAAYFVEDLNAKGPIESLVWASSGAGNATIKLIVDKLRGNPTHSWVRGAGSNVAGSGSFVKVMNIIQQAGNTAPVWYENPAAGTYQLIREPVLQTDVLDRTENRAMMVGAFGLGGTAAVWPIPEGLLSGDNDVGSGFYFLNFGTRPAIGSNLGGVTGWFVHHVRRSNTTSMQECLAINGTAAGTVARRFMMGSTMSGWVFDVVSTVSPEGAYDCPAGSVCRTVDGKFFVKTTASGKNGWVEK